MNQDLTENEVVDRVAAWLQGRGYKVTSTAHIGQQGDDVTAIAPDGKHLFVECKGSISDAGNKGDRWGRASEALFTAIRDKEAQRPQAIHAIAVPDVDGFRRLLDGLRDFTVREGIPVLWVRDDEEWEVWCDSLIIGDVDSGGRG